VTSLFQHGRIRTTITKAKAASRLADQIITLAKRADLHSTRQIQARLCDKTLTKKVVHQIAPSFKERQGGYTRIVRHNYRPGDGAQMVLWQLSDYVEPVVEKDKKKKVKKEKTELGHAHPHTHADEPKTKKKKEEAAAGEVKKEEKKGGGGFLSGLRKFLTGEGRPDGKPKE
jgi:large subunit ribosomal protein L17